MIMKLYIHLKDIKNRLANLNSNRCNKYLMIIKEPLYKKKISFVY